MIESEKGKEIYVRHACGTTCKYHRSQGKTFDINHLGPEGLCLDLYAAAYPYFLTLQQKGVFSWMKDTDTDCVYGQCPAPTGGVSFEVRRKSLDAQVINEGVKKDKLYQLKIIKIEPNDGSYANGCLCTQQEGQEFEFNQGDLLEHMCPAAFASLWPTLKTILNGGSRPWEKDGRVHAMCPDNFTKISFEIRK